jgi:hypothetical protein
MARITVIFEIRLAHRHTRPWKVLKALALEAWKQTFPACQFMGVCPGGGPQAGLRTVFPKADVREGVDREILPEGTPGTGQTEVAHTWPDHPAAGWWCCQAVGVPGRRIGAVAVWVAGG